jgi:hypothetical protein
MKKPVLDFGYLMMIASRYSRYNTVTGLCEVIDNSDEPRVKSKNVSITFNDDENGIIDTIYIADDGLSMTKSEHIDFWSVKKNEMKFEDYDPDTLGKFGVGGKAGPFSFGDTIILITKRQGGEIYKSEENILNYTADIEPEIVTDEETIALFNEKVNSPHGTLIIIKDLIKDYKITRDEFKKKDDCFNNLGLIYGNLKIKHTIDGEEFKAKDIMGGIDQNTGKKVMAKVLCQHHEITVEDCPVPMTLITFHRYRNQEDSIKWDYDKWGLAVVRNNRLTTIQPLRDSSLFGEKGRSHRQSEFGAILFVKNVHDDYLNMPYSKFITTAEKFNPSLLEKLSEQLRKDIDDSAKSFADEGAMLTGEKLRARCAKIVNNLNSHLQNFKMSSKYKKTTPKDENPVDGEKPDSEKNNKVHVNPKPRQKKKVKFLGDIMFGDFGKKADLINIDYDGNNLWNVDVNTAHPLFATMGLNDKKLESMIYYELCLSMAIENSKYTDDEKTFKRLEKNREELHDIQERFVHDMEKSYALLINGEELDYDDNDDDVDFNVTHFKNCEGANVKFEEIEEKDKLTESYAESPSA